MTSEVSKENTEKEFVYTMYDTADHRDLEEAREVIDSVAEAYSRVVLDFSHRQHLSLADYDFVLRLCDHIRRSGLSVRISNCTAGIRDRFAKLNSDQFVTID